MRAPHFIANFNSARVLVPVLLLVVLLSPAEANLRLCGPRLTRTIMSLCRGQVCGGAFVKRSGSSPAQSFLDTHHTMKRSGIATECCENRCSYSYLKSFCCEQA